jgi:hypothetical protein
MDMKVVDLTARRRELTAHKVEQSNKVFGILGIVLAGILLACFA